MKNANRVLLFGIVLCAIGLVLVALGDAPPAAAAESGNLPANAQQFTCYHFGLAADNSYVEPDQCFSYGLGADPFSAGLGSGLSAIVTDFQMTPTTDSTGSYYVTVAQATTGGSQFNPLVYYRQGNESTLAVSTTSPILVIDEGNVINFRNDASSPGAARFYVQGFIVDDLTFSPTALGTLQVAVASNNRSLQGVLLALMVGLFGLFTYRQVWAGRKDA